MNAPTSAREYLAARAALEAAQAVLAQAEQTLKEQLARAGVDSVISGDTKVSVVHGVRPKYDADVLVGLVEDGVVDADLFDRVTSVAVNGKAWKAAAEIGLISETVADKVVTTTEYTQVRVSQI